MGASSQPNHCRPARYVTSEASVQTGPELLQGALDALRTNSPPPAKKESKVNKGSFCPVEGCEVRTRFLKEHALSQRVPYLFRPQILQRRNLRSQVVQALQNMAIRVLGPDGNLRALVERVCGSLSAHNMGSIPSAYSDIMADFCRTECWVSDKPFLLLA